MVKATIKDRDIAIEILTKSFIDVLIPNSINFMFGRVYLSKDKKGCILYIHKWGWSIKKILLEIKLLFLVIGIENLFKVLKREKLIKEFHPKEDFIHLWLMGVVPECQGLGIGSKLLQESLQFYKDKLVYLETTTNENLKFYRKNGFKIFYETFELDYPLYFLQNV